MKISLTKHRFLSQHCTEELLSVIPVMSISENDEYEDELEITELLCQNISTFELMKIAFVFTQCGGILMYNGNITQFAVVIRMLDDVRLMDITTYWYNNEANGILPVYDLGEIIVPPILPRFVATQQTDSWIIEKLQFGEYVETHERFNSQTDAEERARYLNLTQE
jgi:hypothetical protein